MPDLVGEVARSLCGGDGVVLEHLEDGDDVGRVGQSNVERNEVRERNFADAATCPACQAEIFDPAESDLNVINDGFDPITSGVEFHGSSLKANFSAPSIVGGASAMAASLASGA